MCGIAGAWTPERAETLQEDTQRMTDAIRLRGPDGEGHWMDSEVGISLGHRRLAVLDLTPTGAQPMQDASGRFVLTYNGEVYNFKELRDELDKNGATFRGTSDTEVLVEGFARWGIEATLRRTIGMFAIAVWDRRTGTLTLARDRLGEKPLYVAATPQGLLFGSDPRALVAHPCFKPALDHRALRLYLRFGYIPAPHTIYAGARKVRPGTLLTYTSPSGPPQQTVYWDAIKEAAHARTLGPPVDPIGDLEVLLQRTVRQSMVSDVPLGVFLSGGIDSSTIAALMQAESPRPIHSFTIGFAEAGYDEAQDARRVAVHLGTQHTELTVTADEARAVIPELPRIYPEPFADSSQIPTFLVSRLARRHVTVALSGDGGDELFCGYTRYAYAPRLLQRIAKVPRPLRRAGAHTLLALPDPYIGSLGRAAGLVAPARWRVALCASSFPQRAKRFARLLAAGDDASANLRLISIWQDPDLLLRGTANGTDSAMASPSWSATAAEALMLQDTLTYLPDDILVKVDRAAMGCSLETRAPLLSHEVFTAAWRLQPSQKMQDGKGKLPLRAVLQRYVPSELVDRPKAGFAVPIGAWLRGPLRDWAEALLAEDRLRRDGLLNVAPIRQAWQEHLDGHADNSAQLWVILMLQAWLDENSELLAPRP